eukprot:2759123-Pleurochrysis_carterae.AAC.1
MQAATYLRKRAIWRWRPAARDHRQQLVRDEDLAAPAGGRLINGNYYALTIDVRSLYQVVPIGFGYRQIELNSYKTLVPIN